MSTEPLGRQCIFCDHPANSYEHIFPDWINNIFPPDKIGPVGARHVQFVAGNEGAPAETSYLASKLAPLRARIVCCCCNGGWMGEMEGRARPLLELIITGHERHFTPEEQIFIAGWATKIAMLGETIMEYPDRFSREDRWLVRQQKRPPLHAMVFLAAYSGPNVGTFYVRTIGDITKDGTPLTELYVHTILIGRLVLQIRGFPSLPVNENRSLQQLAEPRFHERPIFPPVENCEWPPKFRLDDTQLGLYTAAGKEPPVPLPNPAEHPIGEDPPQTY